MTINTDAETAASYVLLRLMAEVSTPEEAEAELVRMAPQIERHAAIQKHTVGQYWKISSYQEITLYLKPYSNMKIAYDGLVLLAASGWTHGGDEQDGWSQWSVWNPVPGFVLLYPSVKWAELSLWNPDAEDDEEAPD